jgi:hypothetical protein
VEIEELVGAAQQRNLDWKMRMTGNGRKLPVLTILVKLSFPKSLALYSLSEMN